ncbi:MAG: DEAD/DEAH box helicase family protein [Myxococcales bacterium]
MSFKPKLPAVPTADSPRALFHILPRRPFPSLWGHQERILDNYAAALKDQRRDVALELPTGSGKTLVGLLIGEFHRRSSKARVVYLCSTNQLVNQTLARAKEYGIPAVGFTGAKSAYSEQSVSAVQRGEAIAITNYPSIFNAKPGIDEPQIVICDDAHAGENYVVARWSLKIQANGPDDGIFKALVAFFGDLIKPELRTVLGSSHSPREVDLIPLPAYSHRIQQLHELFDAHCYASKTDAKWAWMALKGHLWACNIFVSPAAFLIRPLIPPTHIHSAFAEAEHRVYMSATLGEDGDLERMFGVGKIWRIYANDLRDANTGRRFILFPQMMSEDARNAVGARLFERDQRMLVVTSAGHKGSRVISDQLASAGFTVLNAENIETSLQAFTSATGSVALVLANRYDGIDLAGEACRRMALDGVPGALNLQELFMRERLGAHAVLRNRIRVRLTQAMGRCTRSPDDFALVCCYGRDLLKWCSTLTNSEGLSPELQAELEFGLRQSDGLTEADARENLDHFFGQTDDWKTADAEMRVDAESRKRKPSDSSGALAAAVQDEVLFVQAMWQENFVVAHQHAAKVSDTLSNRPGLKPYRAFWEYMAALATDAAHRASKDDKFRLTFQQHIQTAAKLVGGVRWLAALSFAHSSILPAEGVPLGVEQIEQLLEDWGIRGARFEENLAKARKEIGANEANPFQRGIAALGRMLGFSTKQHLNTGAPDGCWWTEDNLYYAFEAKSDAKDIGPISISTVRQAEGHAKWIAANDKELPPSRRTIVVVVSPKSSIQDKAVGLAGDMRYLTLDQARQLFEDAAAALSEVRGKAIGLDEENLREAILETYHARSLTGDALRARIDSVFLKSLPQTPTR